MLWVQCTVVLLLTRFAAGPIPDALIYLPFLAALELFS